MNEKISKRMLWFSVAFIASSIASVFALSSLLNLSLATAATFVQAIYTISAIAIGGIYAWVKLQIFREFDPHLSISQTVSHHPLGTKYIHLAVTAELKNSSKVSVEIRQALFRLQQIAPLSDDDVETLHEEYSLSQDDENYILWPTYSEIKNTWAPGSFVIEPGEIETEVYEFIVSAELKRVLVYAYFTNDDTISDDDDEGFEEGDDDDRMWEATTVYDII